MDFDQYEAVFNMPKIRLLLFFYFYDQPGARHNVEILLLLAKLARCTSEGFASLEVAENSMACCKCSFIF